MRALKTGRTRGDRTAIRGREALVTFRRVVGAITAQCHAAGLSPYVPERGQCNECGRAYSPLRFDPGQITTAQHFHETHGGRYSHAYNKK